MPSCAAYGCTQRDRTSGITFHRFPVNLEQRKRWIAALRRKDYNPSKTAVVCSRHFRDEDFDRSNLSRIRLRVDAIPSVFTSFPAHLQPKRPVTLRKAPKDRGGSVTSSTSVSSTTATTPGPVLATSPVQYDVPVHVLDYSVDADATAGNPAEVCPTDTPRKVALKRKLFQNETKVTSYRKKIKLLLQSRRRLQKKNASLQAVLNEIKNKDIMSSESISVLKNSAGGVNDLLQRRCAKQSGGTYQKAYTPELRSFALTLHFYSPMAYRYIRKMFDTCLPHPRTLEKWLHTIDGRPGFTSEAFDALKVRTLSRPDKRLVCALMMDEVAIRQQIEWDGIKFVGYIDMGTGFDDDSMPVAKEALTFMVVGVNDSFKLPVAYFLIDGLGGTERANIVNQCLAKLHEAGVTIVSLTFDGSAANLAMVKCLGCNLDVFSNNFRTSFKHPSSNNDICIFLDPCHMLKLVRNTLGDKKSLVDGDGNFVKWDFIQNLHKLQESEGLHFGNRLRAQHVAWHKNKMNVRLAAQLFSESVATSLEFCSEEGFPEFAQCAATVRFIRIFNKLFDLLTSRNLKGKGFKSPLQEKNIAEMRTFLLEAKQYIMSLKESRDGKSILQCNRKTGFVGFCVCIDSVLIMYDHLITSEQFGMKFLCTFKVSQDHLELFFSKLRRLGGCNNNPSVRQFVSAYRKLVVHGDLQDVIRGNCLPLETVPVLTASSAFISRLHCNSPSVITLNSTVTRSRVLDPDDNAVTDHDYAFVPTMSLLSACSEKIVAYIAGFVVFKLKSTLHCERCIEALTDTAYKQICSLIKMKTKGGLVFPSQDVIDVCVYTEKSFRLNVTISGSSLSAVSVSEITQLVLKRYAQKQWFRSLDEHVFECEPTANHAVLLIKAIVEKYLQVRYFYAGKQYTAKLRQKQVKISRQVNTKLILFSGM